MTPSEADARVRGVAQPSGNDPDQDQGSMRASEM